MSAANIRPLRPTARRILRFIPALPDNATTIHHVAQLAGHSSPAVLREIRYLLKAGVVQRLGTGVQARFIRKYGGAA